MPTYNEQVGARLRSIRKQRGLSLQDVQRISEQEFKAAVLGAYERGERSLSLPRLRKLSEFYNVPMLQFLPSEEGVDPTAIKADITGVTIDLNKMDDLTGEDSIVIERFLRGIQSLRQDYNGKVLTIRADDLRTLALMLNRSPADFSEHLSDLGVKAT